MIKGFLVGLLWGAPIYLLLFTFLSIKNDDKEFLASLIFALIISFIIAFIPYWAGFNPYIYSRVMLRTGKITGPHWHFNMWVVIGAVLSMPVSTIYFLVFGAIYDIFSIQKKP